MQSETMPTGDLVAANLAADPDPGWRDRLVDHHDYIWARLPFVVPMAFAVARRRRDRRAELLARGLLELRPIVLDHLTREERALALHRARAIRDRLHDDHLAVATLLASLREDADRATEGAPEGTTEQALASELARLDEHLAAQIALEERLLAMS